MSENLRELKQQVDMLRDKVDVLEESMELATTILAKADIAIDFLMKRYWNPWEMKEQRYMRK
jgi:hypothetical protein